MMHASHFFLFFLFFLSFILENPILYFVMRKESNEKGMELFLYYLFFFQFNCTFPNQRLERFIIILPLRVPPSLVSYRYTVCFVQDVV
jgi:hypothetical protein